MGHLLRDFEHVWRNCSDFSEVFILIFVVALNHITTSLSTIMNELHWAIEDLELALRDTADILTRKKTFEAVGSLALLTASEFVVFWRLRPLCDCCELVINWPLLFSGGAVVCLT